MVKNFILLLVLSTFFAACTGDENKEDEDNQKTNKEEMQQGKYPFKSGIIKYKQYDSKNYTIAYFDNFGDVEKIETVNFIEDKETIGVILIRDGFVYQYSPEINAGSKRKYEDYNQVRINFEKMEETSSENVKVDKLDNEEILGKECSVYMVQAKDEFPVKYYIWENMLLKQEDYVTIEAEEIIEDADVSDISFELPENIELIEY